MIESGNYFNNKEIVKSLLSSYGYPISDNGNDYIQTAGLFRNGKSEIGSIVIYYKDNLVIDFSDGKKYDIQSFFKVISNSQGGDFNVNELSNLTFCQSESQIKTTKIFDKSLLSYIDTTDNSYILNRNISKETAKEFGVGWVGDVKGKLKNRYCFPIYDEKNNIIGFTGRTVNPNNKIKWQHTGIKSNWIWPRHLNDKHISNCKSVILVESPMCVLSLWDAGIKNVLCLFGVEMSLPILNYILRKNVDYIIIALNNEPDNNSIGNTASEKLKARLKKYFDSRSILVKLPKKKDFNELSKEENRTYGEELKFLLGEKYFKYE